MQKTPLSDYDAIMQTVQIYLDGSNESGAATKPAFHENATINAAPIQVLFDLIDQSGPGNATGRIDVLDVVNDIAVARVTIENSHGMDFVDFHLLMKTEEGWKIIAKAFTMFPIAEQE